MRAQLEPIARRLRSMGGLPVERAYELADRWAYAELGGMEAEEWAEGTAFEAKRRRKKK